MDFLDPWMTRERMHNHEYNIEVYKYFMGNPPAGDDERKTGDAKE
jgi:hypothetical protein